MGCDKESIMKDNKGVNKFRVLHSFVSNRYLPIRHKCGAVFRAIVLLQFQQTVIRCREVFIMCSEFYI